MASVTEIEAWRSYEAMCLRDRAELEHQLAAFTGRSGTCGPATGFQWLDTTEREKQRLRDSIAEIDAAITEFRRLTEFRCAYETYQ